MLSKIKVIKAIETRNYSVKLLLTHDHQWLVEYTNGLVDLTTDSTNDLNYALRLFDDALVTMEGN